MDNTVCIIGSGPTGIAAAHCLIERGISVCLLDGGLKLENHRQANLEKLSGLSPFEWAQSEVEFLKGDMKATDSGVAVKLTYGSDYPYRDAERIFLNPNKEIGVAASLGCGGFSSVWGAAMLPYLPEDTADWAIKIDDLSEHYKAVIKLTGLAGREDALGERFPLYGRSHNLVPLSSHIKSFLSDLEKSETELKRRGVLFGQSRLAVAERNLHGTECAACRLCMYGCPYGLIYNSADALPELRKSSLFTYHTDVIVERFSENETGATVYARHRESGQKLVFNAKRLMIGAGVLSTARLVLESMNDYDSEVTLKDSQYFLLPLLRFAATKEAENEPQTTLSQAFIEVLDEAVSDKSVHLQIYGYNELYRQAIEHKLRVFGNITNPAINAFLRRFILIQGYLHSDYSHSIRLRLEKSAKPDAISKLSMKVRHNPETDEKLKKLIAKLASLRSIFKAVPLKYLLKKGEVGRGFHTGGTFPMRVQPEKFETDTLGRLPNWKKIHLIDASVFPSIPANTITFTAMANAHRVASQIEV